MTSIPYPALRRGRLLRRLFCLSLSCAVFCAGHLAAAEGVATGTISGQVSNKATGDLLASADVSIEGTALHTVTDRTGAFSLAVPAGAQTLVITYTGLDPVRMPVTVAAGQTATEDVAMTSAVYTLDKFTVKGLREASAIAIQSQREAPNEKVVVSADTYGNPAANAGELIQRLPGIAADIVGSVVRTIYVRGLDSSFAQLQIDGNRVATSTGTSASRVFQIEQYGTANLASVEVIRAPTPDMDANAIGGYVNLITKRAFDLPGRSDTLTLGTQWRDRRGASDSPYKDHADNLDLLGFTHSDVYSVLGGKRNLGVIASYYRRADSTLQDENGPIGLSFGSGDWNVTNPNNPLQTQIGSGELVYPAVSQNFGLNTDYRFSDHSWLAFSFSANTNVQSQDYYRMEMTVPNSLASFTPGSTTNDEVTLASAGGTADSAVGSLYKHSLNYQFGLSGETRLLNDTAKLSFTLTESYANIFYPAFIQMNALTAPGVAWEYNRGDGNTWYPKFTQLAGPSVNNPASFAPHDYSVIRYSTPGRIETAKVDFQKSLDLPVPTYIKVGAKVDDEKRSAGNIVKLYTWGGPDGLPGSGDEGNIIPWLGHTYSSAAGHYGPYPFLSQLVTGKPNDITTSPYWTQTSADAYNSVDRTLSSYGKADETVSSGYFLGNVQLGHLRLLGGLRVERTAEELTTLLRDTNPADNTSSNTALAPAADAARAQAKYAQGLSTVKGVTTNVFPGIHLTYEPKESLLIRASWNVSIARPPVANLLPNETINTAGSGTITIGNPGLKPYQSNNFEVSLAKYFEPAGMFEIGAFLKNVTNYIQNQTAVIQPGVDYGFGGQYVGYSLTQPVNSGDARFRGIEASYSQQFTFLPGLFSGLGAFANYTYLQAKGAPNNPTFTTVLNGNTPRSANFGLSYVYQGLQVRFLGNFRGKTPTTGAGATQNYLANRMIYGLKLQYTVNKHFDVFADADNLTDEPAVPYLFQGRIKYGSFKEGVGFDAGIKTRF